MQKIFFKIDKQIVIVRKIWIINDPLRKLTFSYAFMNMALNRELKNVVFFFLVHCILITKCKLIELTGKKSTRISQLMFRMFNCSMIIDLKLEHSESFESLKIDLQTENGLQQYIFFFYERGLHLKKITFFIHGCKTK